MTDGTRTRISQEPQSTWSRIGREQEGIRFSAVSGRITAPACSPPSPGPLLMAADPGPLRPQAAPGPGALPLQADPIPVPAESTLVRTARECRPFGRESIRPRE